MYKKIILSLLPLLFVLFSCGDGNVDPQVDRNSIEFLYPSMKLGHKWTYERIYYNITDTIISSIDTILEIQGYRTYAGFDPKSLYWNIDTTTKSISIQSPINNDLNNVIFPLISKDYYVGQIMLDITVDDTKFIRKVVSTTETVDVPAGTFKNCIKIETIASDVISGMANVETFWYRKDIGLVKFEYIPGDIEYNFIMNLISKNF